jgi:cytochrome c
LGGEGMMFESRELIGFDDMVGIQYHCLRCHAKYSLPVDGAQRYPSKCANCNEDWFSGQMDGADKNLFVFLSLLRQIQAMAKILEEISFLKLTVDVVSQEPEENLKDKD